MLNVAETNFDVYALRYDKYIIYDDNQEPKKKKTKSSIYVYSFSVESIEIVF